MNNKTFAMIILMIVMLSLSACSSNNAKDPANNGTGTVTETTEPSANASETPEESDIFELGSEPLSFRFYGNYDWWPNVPWGSDPSSKWIQENKQVAVTEVSSGGAAKQKLSTMIAGGNLPEVMMLDRGPDVDKLIEGGQLVPLDDYIAKYPNIAKYAGDDTLNLLRSGDGKLYTLPNWYTASPTGNAGYAINLKIYKELGSPKLETFDDLYVYLKKVQASYPDVVPLEVDTKATGVLMMATGFEEEYLNTYLFEKAILRDNEMTSLFLDPTYTETIQFASKLFREKLITQDAFTQKNDQVTEKLKNGRIAVYTSFNVTSSNTQDAHNFLKSGDPGAGYKVIWPLAKAGVSKDKVYPNSYSTLGWNAVVITKSAENPEKIFAYLDWLTGPEGQAVTNFGPPGRYWDSINDKGYAVPNEKWASTQQAEKDKDKMGNFNWLGNSALVDGTKAEIEMALPDGLRNWITEHQVTVTWKTSKKANAYINLAPPADSEEGIAAAALNDLHDQYLAKALFAGSDEEVVAILKEAHDAAVNQGYDKLLAYKTKKYQENVSKLGSK